MIKLINEDYLAEMATIAYNQHENIGICVSPDPGHIGDPYFKFYNSASYTSAKLLIRIYFKKVGYTIHKSDSKKPWKLNSKERKLLVKTLQDECDYVEDINNWDYAKLKWNTECLRLKLKIAKYFAGGYDEEYKDNPSYVPSTLKMPDYTKLNVN